MSRLGKMSSWQRTFVRYAMFTCSITGLLYLLGRQFHIQRTIFGTYQILVAHGITALVATLALGSVLTFHLQAGYKSKNKLLSGFSQLSFLAVVFISGALLYYGPEEMRDAVINTHWVAGLIFFALFLIHLRTKPHNANKSPQDQLKDNLNQS